MNQKNKKLIKTFSILLAIALVVCWVIYDNENVRATEITLKIENLPEDFSGCKIVHVSDLHNVELGDNNEDLLSLIREASPDVIFFTGDIIDGQKPDIPVAAEFINAAAEIAPVYYVMGNHDPHGAGETYPEGVIFNENITVLHNEDVFWQMGESKIQIIGIDDPMYVSAENEEEYIRSQIEGYKDSEYFKILLSHRPEQFDVYVENDMNLVFSGHAHGGQFRLPFIGGLYAPHQGKFPKYDSGVHSENNTNLVVSRGLGNSTFPIRLNNSPEVIIITLEK